MGKTMENHLVDPTEKAENAEVSENVTDKRNQSQSLAKHMHQILGLERFKLVSAFSAFSVGSTRWFSMVFPTSTPKVQRCADLVDLEKC